LYEDLDFDVFSKRDVRAEVAAGHGLAMLAEAVRKEA